MKNKYEVKLEVRLIVDADTVVKAKRVASVVCRLIRKIAYLSDHGMVVLGSKTHTIRVQSVRHIKRVIEG